LTLCEFIVHEIICTLATATRLLFLLFLLTLDRLGDGDDDGEDDRGKQGGWHAAGAQENAEREASPGHRLVATKQPHGQWDTAAKRADQHAKDQTDQHVFGFFPAPAEHVVSKVGAGV
jgi:hypothetical protein